MKKLIKLSFTFVLLAIFVKAQAQVIESVSFTPAKTGSYETIATRSVTYFGSGLRADHITAFGQKLTLDTPNNALFMSGTSGDAVILNVARDYYGAAVSSSTNDVKIGYGGKLYTTSNATITNSKADVVYGGDTNFAKITSTLQDNSTLYIDNVQMNNPGCAIKWVKLPATDTAHDYSDTSNTASFTNYWFAYCDYSAGSSPTVGENWLATTTSFNGIAFCNAGFSAYNDCTRTYNSEGKIATSSFNCTDIKTYKCNSSYQMSNIISSSGYDNCVPTSKIAIFDEESPLYGDGSYATCAGAIRRFPAKWEYYGGYGDKVVGYPVASFDCREDYCNSSEIPTITKNLFNRDNALFCGFAETGVGGNYQSHGAKAFVAVKNYPYCHNKTQLESCWEKAGVSYSTYSGWQNYSDAQLCQAIATANTSVGTSFSCVKNTPAPSTYQAFRVAPCVTGTKTFKKCYDGYCIPNNDSQMWCKGNKNHPKGIQDTPVSVGYVKRPEGWAEATNPEDGRLYLVESYYLSGSAPDRTDEYQFDFTDETKYIPKAFSGTILNCQAE